MRQVVLRRSRLLRRFWIASTSTSRTTTPLSPLHRTRAGHGRSVDAELATSGSRGPLHGVPIVIKEAIDVAGLPSTMGYAPFSSQAGGVDLIPVVDAPVVTRLREAGAIILGKTNIPAFSADDSRADSSWAGPTFNAYDRNLVPGASSSGTATAVSASLAVLGMAEETGGSIENPAGATESVVIKPTFGLVPNTGVAPLAGGTRDVLGPHAKTVYVQPLRSMRSPGTRTRIPRRWPRLA